MQSGRNSSFPSVQWGQAEWIWKTTLWTYSMFHIYSIKSFVRPHAACSSVCSATTPPSPLSLLPDPVGHLPPSNTDHQCCQLRQKVAWSKHRSCQIIIKVAHICILSYRKSFCKTYFPVLIMTRTLLMSETHIYDMMWNKALNLCKCGFAQMRELDYSLAFVQFVQESNLSQHTPNYFYPPNIIKINRPTGWKTI